MAGQNIQKRHSERSDRSERKSERPRQSSMESLDFGRSESEFWSDREVEVSMCPALDFMDSYTVQVAIGAIIFVNVFTSAAQTDVPDFVGWHAINTIFLALFCVELVLRLLQKGPYFFSKKNRWWHALDTLIVVLGLFDLLAPLFTASRSRTHPSSLLRMLRLLRLLRILRVGKMIPSIGSFFKALWNMINMFTWIFLVLFFFIFCAAIMLTRVLSKITIEEQDVEIVRQRFGSVWTSWFTLFQVVTMDNWDVIAAPVIRINPFFRLFFGVFIASASWVLISALTAVASDSMIAHTVDQRLHEQKEREKRHQRFISFLRECFRSADADGDDEMDKEEFYETFSKDFVVHEMQRLGIPLGREDFFKVWDMLDSDDSGTLTIDEFVSGLAYLHETLCTKHVVNVDFQLRKFDLNAGNRIDRLQEDINELQQMYEDMHESLANQEAMLSNQTLSLWLWNEWMQKTGLRRGATFEGGLLTPDMGLVPTELAVGRTTQFGQSRRSTMRSWDESFALGPAADFTLEYVRQQDFELEMEASSTGKTSASKNSRGSSASHVKKTGTASTSNSRSSMARSSVARSSAARMSVAKKDMLIANLSSRKAYIGQ